MKEENNINKTPQLNPRDFEILEKIKNNRDLGTVELAKEIGIAPKNLINHLKRYEKDNIISKKTIPTKPKGRKRIWLVNEDFEPVRKSYEKWRKLLKRLSEKEKKNKPISKELKSKLERSRMTK